MRKSLVFIALTMLMAFSSCNNMSNPDWTKAQKQMELRNYPKTIVHLKRAKEKKPRPPNYNHILSCIAETYALNNEVDSAFQYLDLYVDALNEEKSRMERSPERYVRAYSYLSVFAKKEFQIMHKDPRWPILMKRADEVVKWIKEYESPENQLKIIKAERKHRDDFMELKVEVDSLEKIGKYDLAFQACKDVPGYKNSYLVLCLIAGLYCSKGDIEMTFDYLEQARLITEGRAQLHQRFMFILTVGGNPQFRKLSSDPRWEIYEQMMPKPPTKP